MSEILTIDTETDLIDKTKIDPLPLYDDNHFMLGQVMPEVTGPIPNPQLTTLSQQLKMTMKLYGGLGLSANQCGVQARVFVMWFNEQVITCINPKVVEMSDGLKKDKEGCLSFPGMYLNIPRNEWIVAEFTNENGVQMRARMDGLSARCFLHELDHMNGVKFTNHVGPVAVKLAREKQAKLIKKIKRQKKGKA